MENQTQVSPRRGVLLVNLGSPDSPTETDVRKYLDEFLMDPCVLDSPWPIRRFVVSCFILPKRPKESAEAYKCVWTEEGSPLIVTSYHLADRIRENLEYPVGLGMRYGTPSIEEGLKDLLTRAKEPLEEILLFPLYPHFAMSSYETVVKATTQAMEKLKIDLPLRSVPPFYDHPAYIDSLVASAQPYLDTDWDYLLFSYHGLPERHLRKADPTGTHCLASPDCCSKPSAAHKTCYRHQAYRTTEEFVKKAGIPKEKYSIAFQSRLGRDPWLKPYTDYELERLAKEGIKKILVICPAFVSDCLETLEEIGIRGKQSFEEAGGEELRLVYCMNEHPSWIATATEMCREPAPLAGEICAVR